jgi:thiol-disulfide isomerase/thioredoxin
MFDLEKLVNNSENVSDYLLTSSNKTMAFKENLEKYKPDEETINKLKNYTEKVLLFAFSAEWCPDCQKHVPALGKIAVSTGIKVKIFGHLMRDPKRPKGYWSIPPSPPEVEMFNVRRIPTIIILDREGNGLGQIVENPPEGKTLEKALLAIIESRLPRSTQELSK